MSINISIALIVIVLTPLSLIAAAFPARSSYKKFREQSQLRGEITGLAEEMLTNHTAVRLFCYEKKSQERYEKINSRLHTVGIKAQFYSSLTNPGTRFINGIVYAFVAVIGAVSVINGNFSVGMLSGFLAYASQYTKPFNEISGVITELQNAIASAARVFELIDEREESSDDGLSELFACDGSVNINDVYFSYNKEKPLIEALELYAKAGQKIAIVGPTGCGKTTIINLLMRFYDADSGEIIVSGQNIKNMKRKALRSMFGMVLQDTWLFSGTIKENIAFGKPDASIVEIQAAAMASYAHDFINRLPDGYETVISEDGAGISQGEKQLLCIARIMLTKPPILILDEATSSIDTRTEIKIQQAFSEMMKGRTSFIVAHRLSTIKNADIILAMNKGRVIEQGSHEELLNKGGFYSELYNSQFSGNV
jgi:ATP-binding cassette subfamily B protein